MSILLPCLQCETMPRSDEVYRLCARCRSVKGLRRIYKRRRNWTPEWDAHLQSLVEKAKLRIPLFSRTNHESDQRSHQRTA